MIIFDATAVCFSLKIGNIDFRFAAERKVSGVYAICGHLRDGDK